MKESLEYMKEPLEKTGKKIIDIKILTKHIDIYFADEKISVLPNTFSEYPLFIGKSVSAKLLDEIKDYDEFSKSLNYAISLVDKYVYSTKKLTDKLKKKEVSVDYINRIIAYLNKNKLLDDDQLAKDLIKSAINKKKGPKYIKSKLNDLGIDKKAIDKLLDEVDINAYKGPLRDRIKELDTKLSKRDYIDKKERIIASLLRDGYSLTMINEEISKIKLSKTNYQKALLNDYQKIKRQYDDKNKIIDALKRKGYRYNQIQNILKENEYDFY